MKAGTVSPPASGSSANRAGTVSPSASGSSTMRKEMMLGSPKRRKAEDGSITPPHEWLETIGGPKMMNVEECNWIDKVGNDDSKVGVKCQEMPIEFIPVTGLIEAKYFIKGCFYCLENARRIIDGEEDEPL